MLAQDGDVCAGDRIAADRHGIVKCGRECFGCEVQRYILLCTVNDQREGVFAAVLGAGNNSKNIVTLRLDLFINAQLTVLAYRVAVILSIDSDVGTGTDVENNIGHGGGYGAPKGRRGFQGQGTERNGNGIGNQVQGCLTAGGVLQEGSQGNIHGFAQCAFQIVIPGMIRNFNGCISVHHHIAGVELPDIDGSSLFTGDQDSMCGQLTGYCGSDDRIRAEMRLPAGKQPFPGKETASAQKQQNQDGDCNPAENDPSVPGTIWGEGGRVSNRAASAGAGVFRENRIVGPGFNEGAGIIHKADAVADF